jgi:hypothetical protein
LNQNRKLREIALGARSGCRLASIDKRAVSSSVTEAPAAKSQREFISLSGYGALLED